jgi:LmbE family N-acetylglucosaminyl deacetylase
MTINHRLLCVLAHPDDESLGLGGTLAKYARQGVETYLITATRGEQGRFGLAGQRPPIEEVGRVREGELQNAARILGIKEVHFLDYVDKDLDEADPAGVIEKITGHIRKIKPQVVITFGPEGGYGHPDHIAISQFTTAAVMQSAGSKGPGIPHSVSKLYYMAWPPDKWEAYQAAFKTLKSTVDGVDRLATPWPDWAITTRIDTRDFWKTTWQAVSCHKTQMAIYSQLENLTEAQHHAIWGTQEYYRVFSLVNSGRQQETDLFEGIK